LSGRPSPLVPLASLLFLGAAPGHSAPAPPRQADAGPAINYRARPQHPFDPQRLKRRPVIDGVIGDAEWDPLYTASERGINGTVYLNWDDDNLYVAARSDQPAWLVLNVDASADGWLRGADNLELTVAPLMEGAAPALTARVLDAVAGRDTPVWNDKSVDPRSMTAAGRLAGRTQMVEIAIPRGTAGLAPRPSGSLSVRADFLPATAAPAPIQPYEPHLLVDVTLVEARVIAAPGATPRIHLEDARVTAGQELKAILELAGQGTENIAVRSITWKGEGAAADLLRLVREVNLPPLAAGKPLRVAYSSTIPVDAAPGFYQLTATAELEGGRTAVATTSFAIVEPFVLSIVPEHDPVTVAGQTRLKINVEVACAVKGYTRADIELEAPGGWVVEGRRRKSFDARREDVLVRVPFFIQIPPSSQAGEYIVHATVTWKGRTWKTHQTIRVNRAG